MNESVFIGNQGMQKWAVILLVSGLLLTGCASEKRKTNMDATLRLYEKSIKWGMYADAQTVLENPEPQELLDRYGEVKVVSYDVVRQEIVGDFEQLNQIVDIKFYHEQQGTIKTVRDVQMWIYDDDRETWVLQSGLPDFMSATE